MDRDSLIINILITELRKCTFFILGMVYLISSLIYMWNNPVISLAITLISGVIFAIVANINENNLDKLKSLWKKQKNQY
jgi:hypothetical protein